MLFYYTFMAYEVDKWGNKMLVGTRKVTPGADDLYKTIREFALSCGLGKYRIFDLDPDSPSFQHHVFENGVIKNANTFEHIQK